ELFAETSRLGMPALAMTDHGNLFGAYDFYQQATAAGVKPIIGLEAYQAPGSRHGRERVRWGDGGENDVSGGGAYLHLTLLAYNAEGLRNLFALSSKAWLEGFYRSARLDKEILAEHSAGLIATTSCPSSEIQIRLRRGEYDLARQAAADYRDIFGEENFFCELMDHGIGIERAARDGLTKLRDDLRLPPLATNDLHYTYAGDATAQEALLCVQSGSTLADPNRFRFEAQDFYLKSAEEMRQVWREVPEACDNTLLIAERVGSYDEVFASRDLMPAFPVPEGHTAESWLREEVSRGLAQRYGGDVPAEHQKQAEYELDVICQMGYPGYFLVVADLIRYAKENGIRTG
ncbi:MAG: PHP domain-containing protein, partial [Micromonosporaceae bacterium]